MVLGGRRIVGGDIADLTWGLVVSVCVFFTCVCVCVFLFCPSGESIYCCVLYVRFVFEYIGTYIERI